MSNLAELSGRSREQLMESASPALRAALGRCTNPASQRGGQRFESFIGPVA
ncbi:hypothetical protein ACFROC_00455 [Nocardia tengchongensis]|uniref:hypothetical protein n=1 Tax=Nocardia tengchongensis TaxID=2055889 RepID=UPI00367BADD6